MSLDSIREDIEQTDLRLIALLIKRMGLVSEAFAENRELGLPLENVDREQDLMHTVISQINWPIEKHRVTTFYQHVINLCKLEAYKE